jgi:hypothetical protein
MTVKEELIKILGDMPGIAWSPSARETIADHLLANGVTVQKWIPISERLPEPTNLVVALTAGGDRIIARLDKYGWLRYGGYETERLRPITHWMPLPDPPKEEA